MYILWVGMCSWILVFDDDHMHFHTYIGGCCGRYRMVVGFKNTYASSSYFN